MPYSAVPLAPTDYDQFADIYDVEYADYHAIVGDTDFYRAYCAEISTPVLDLACGTGRIAISLARSGIAVVGVDISKGMLAKARAKVEGEPAEVQRRLTFLRADMRIVELPRRFDFAYIGFRSFMLLLDDVHQTQALRNTFRYLSPGGRLVVSLSVPTIERLMLYKTTPPDQYVLFGEFRHPNGRDRIVETERKWCDEFRQIGVHRLRHTTVDGQGNETECIDRTLVIRWTHRYEFQHLVHLCGYEVEDIFADYSSAPLTEGSKEMIWVLKRPQ